MLQGLRCRPSGAAHTPPQQVAGRLTCTYSYQVSAWRQLSHIHAAAAARPPTHPPPPAGAGAAAATAEDADPRLEARQLVRRQRAALGAAAQQAQLVFKVADLIDGVCGTRL